MKTLAWLAVAVLVVIGVASAVTRTIAVTRVLGGAPAAEVSPLDRQNQRQVTAHRHAGLAANLSVPHLFA